ncbi:MAG TPA: hypothetical protein PKY73_19305, partial [Hyphomonas sp.]|nr:hypothetical protein [Hyphomonas sp.]
MLRIFASGVVIGSGFPAGGVREENGYVSGGFARAIAEAGGFAYAEAAGRPALDAGGGPGQHWGHAPAL